MNRSTQSRWQGRWIAGAGLACLGAGGFLVSGCTTPLTADLNAPSKKNQQVAKSSGSAAVKKSSQKVAAKDASGKARVSDLDGATQTRIVAQKTPSKPDESKRPVSQTRRPETQLASASTSAQEPAPSRPDGSTADANAVAAKKGKSAATQSAAVRASSEVAARTLPDNGSIKQTAGNGQSPAMAKNAKQKVESKPLAEQRANPESQAADAGTTLASEHERRRADRLMERAHERYRSGYPEEARRLAFVASELEKSRQAIYQLGEESPSDYITWLQSSAPAGSYNPPVIRPQQDLDRQSMKSPQTRSSIAAAGAESSHRRRLGDVIRANADSHDPASPDTAADAATATRSNTGVDLAASEAPRFTTANLPNSRAGANAGLVEVPVPPKPRSADASVAMTNAGPSRLDSPAIPEAAHPVANADSLQETPAPAPAPLAAKFDKSVATSPTAVTATDDAQTENDSFAETPGLIPARTTQLTIASLVGLVTGVAGMFGLSWWRHQERRHYAAGK